MKRMLATTLVAGIFGGLPPATMATSPQQDLKEFRAYFMEKFPDTPFEDFQNGIYSINPDRRQEWTAMMDFPPYEPGVEYGKELYEKDKSAYVGCLPNGGIGVRHEFPYFDRNSGTVITLEQSVNDCRESAGLEPYGWKKGDLAALMAYLASTSNGKKLDIEVPDDERALEWYERGKTHFYAKRGQLNLACANCHVDAAGMQLRANILSPALGQLSHFPVYRKKWEARGSGITGGFGTVHRRYGGCNKQVRAKPFPAQSDEYKALEYFHTYMSNGIPVNAPGVRQ